MTFEEFISEWQNNDDFIRVNTSGSTGIPKEIKLSKDFVRASALRTIKYFGIDSSSLLYSCISPDFIGGKMMAVRAEVSGAKFLSEKPSNQPLREYSSKEEIDLLSVVPSQMIFILENKNILPVIRNIIIGGSAIHDSLRSKIAKSGINAYETYGMTETASHIALRKISENPACFKTFPDIKVSTDPEGCLKIKYYNGFEIITNDIAEIISEREFLIKGRKDNIIISGGKKINPAVIENKISSIISSDYYFKGVKDEKWGEKLVLAIEGEGNEHDKKIILEKIKPLLKNWEIPKEIIFFKTFLRTPGGKIKRILPS